MAGWFRLYDEFLDDPKVQRLPLEDFRAYVNLLCLANRNDGFLPPIEEVAFALRMDNIGAISVVDRLVIATLFDRVKGGTNGMRIAPHGWTKRQYKSDSSTERTKRFRERHRTVSGNAPEQSRTEQNIPIDKSIGSAATRGSRLPSDFEVPAEWIQWAMDERHWDASDAQAEARNFVDFWHSKSGKDATKLDWRATWRVWVRNSRRPGVVSSSAREMPLV